MNRLALRIKHCGGKLVKDGSQALQFTVFHFLTVSGDEFLAVDLVVGPVPSVGGVDAVVGDVGGQGAGHVELARPGNEIKLFVKSAFFSDDH